MASTSTISALASAAQHDAELAQQPPPLPSSADDGAASASSAAAAAAAAPLPPALLSLIVSLDTALDGVEDALEPYLAVPLKKALTSLPPLEAARLNTTFAFCATSLLYSEWRATVRRRRSDVM